MSEVIPRNQASSAYQRLNFTQFDVPPPTAPDPIADASTLATASDDPLEIAPGVQLPTLDDLERIHQEAHREGYAAGYEEGSARGRMEAAELHQLVQSFDQALGQFDQEVAEEIQALAPEAIVVKAFNTIFAQLLPAEARQGKTLQVFVASDDEAAKGQVAGSGTRGGFGAGEIGVAGDAKYFSRPQGGPGGQKVVFAIVDVPAKVNAVGAEFESQRQVVIDDEPRVMGVA